MSENLTKRIERLEKESRYLKAEINAFKSDIYTAGIALKSAEIICGDNKEFLPDMQKSVKECLSQRDYGTVLDAISIRAFENPDIGVTAERLTDEIIRMREQNENISDEVSAVPFSEIIGKIKKWSDDVMDKSAKNKIRAVGER